MYELSYIFSVWCVTFQFLCFRTTTAGTSYGTTTEDYDEYEPLFSLGVRSPRQIYSSSSFRKHDWEVQDINCQGVPFTTIPGKLGILLEFYS